MKTYDRLFASICSFDNLMASARAAEKGRRTKDNVGRFRTRIEAHVLRLQEELRSGAYQPGSYREFWIREPKERMISAAPYRDRVGRAWGHRSCGVEINDLRCLQLLCPHLFRSGRASASGYYFTGT